MCFGFDSTLAFCARLGHVLTWKQSTPEGRSRSVVRVAVRFHPSLPQSRTARDMDCICNRGNLAGKGSGRGCKQVRELHIYGTLLSV
jgi:hypothetical protein